MSRIDDLIAEHCPNGVDFLSLGEIGTWYGGGTPSKSREDYWRGGTIPWLSPKDMGKPTLSTTEDYITEDAVAGSATRLLPARSVALVVRSSILDRQLPTALVTVPFALNQDMKAVVPRNDVLPEYLAYLLRSMGPVLLARARKKGGSVASIEVLKLLSARIPVPPIAVQHEIVRILDTFTQREAALEARLEAELAARRRQYAHFRDALVASFERDDVPWRGMHEVGEFFRGRRFTKDDVAQDGLPSIHYGEIYTHYGTFAHQTVSHVNPDLAANLRFAQKGDVVIAGVGETVEDVAKAVAWLGDDNVAIHDDCFAFRHSMNPKFVSYYFQTSRFHAEKNKHVARAKVKRVSARGLGSLSIPVPPREEQDRIIEILDSFDALVNDLSVGLSAEIRARRQQYEYYRDRLLTFKELA